MAGRSIRWVRSSGVGMAAAEQHPLARALVGLSVCIGRPPALPRTPAGCAELLQALVTWAAPGPEGSDQKKVPDRAVAAIHASLLLLDALRAKPHDSHVTSNGAAQQEPRAYSAEESGKFWGSAQLSKGAHGLEGPIYTENGEVSPLAENKGETQKPKQDSDWPVFSFSPGSLDAQWVMRCSTAPLLLLSATHSHVTPWTNKDSRQMAMALLGSLLDLTQSASVGELLRGRLDHPYDTFGEALGLLGPRLRKDAWESHPEAMLVFAWMLLQVPRPHLSNFIHRAIPPSLLLSDDYRLDNKVLGIRCLNHIIVNVPGAELRQYNRAMVVYHALRNHLYSTETEIIEVVLPCLSNLFPVLQKPKPPLGTFQKEEENPADQVMQLVLINMEMEHKIALRRVYARNLPALLDRLGYKIVRHMSRLLHVIVEYLEISDGPEEYARLSILETVQGTIKYAWPRIAPRHALLLKSLVKLLYDISSESCQLSALVIDELVNQTTDCLLLLDSCCKGQVKTTLRAFLSVNKEPILLKCIHRVLEDS